MGARRLAWLLLIGATPALAQSLVFQGVPTSLRLGGRSDALFVERLDAAGQPVTTGGQLPVTFTAPAGGQVSLAPQPFAAWSLAVTVNIPAASSRTPPLYLRLGRRGLVNLFATASGFTDASATLLVRDDALTCDVETGTRLDTEVPPGPFNTLYAPTPSNTLAASMAGAHRGTFGLRLVDAQEVMGNAADTALYDDGAPIFGDYHARTWVRLVASRNQGSAIILQLTNAQAVSPSLLDVVLVAPDFSLQLAGFGADAGYSRVSTDAGLTLGQWQLLEFSVTGAGTADGGRYVWLDGALVLEQTHVDFSGPNLSVGRIAVGEPYASDLWWMGTLDFDDVRSAGVPLASRLDVHLASDAGFVGECQPMELQLRATWGNGLASTLEPVPVTLDAGLDGELFLDPDCAVAGANVTMVSGAPVALFGLRASAPGVTVSAATLDFLPGRGVLTSAVAPALDLAPLLSRATPGQVISFVVTGGTGRGVRFGLTVNASGASLDATGRYTAGPVVGGFDVMEVHDSAGQSALATVEVVAGVTDAGVSDAGLADAGLLDAGTTDAGPTEPGPRPLAVGCGCGAMPGAGFAWLVFGALARRRLRG